MYGAVPVTYHSDHAPAVVQWHFSPCDSMANYSLSLYMARAFSTNLARLLLACQVPPPPFCCCDRRCILYTRHSLGHSHRHSHGICTSHVRLLAHICAVHHAARATSSKALAGCANTARPAVASWCCSPFQGFMALGGHRECSWTGCATGTAACAG